MNLFEKILSRKILGESIRYIIVGFTTTLVNIVIYQGLLFFGVDYKIANIFAVVMCKVYGYAANKMIVFRTYSADIRELLKEIMRFICARGVTGLLDYFGLLMAVEIFGFDKIISKYVISILVIIVNYVMGKYLVFRRRDDANV